MTEVREIPFGRPWVTDEDRARVMEVLEGHILTHGPNCKAFEDEFAQHMGDGYAVSTSSCWASLHLAMINLGLGPGDEVLVPAQTHVATVHSVEFVGAKPVFVDCELQSGNVNIDLMEDLITDKTKAIVVVHFVGIPVDMVRVMDIANRHGLAVVEDCALAVGSRVDGRHVGLFGHSGCYSFYPVKHITTGEGGMFVSQHENVVKEVSYFRAFSVDRTHTERQIPGVYDVTNVGMNYRMSEMQAALGRGQVEKIPPILKARAENFALLKGRLSQVEHVHVLDSAEERLQNSHYCLVALLQGDLAKKRDEIVLALKEQQIGTSVYYPHPVPRLQYYREKYGYAAGQCPGAEAISDEAFALPVGPHLDSADINHLADILIPLLS